MLWSIIKIRWEGSFSSIGWIIAPIIDAQTLEEIKGLEIEAVQLAESGKAQEALDRLEKALTLCPQYASALNNRAQVFRIMGRSNEAMADLNQAIELAYDYSLLGKVMSVVQ